MISTGKINKQCAILYSGGTDSTCAAAVMAEKFESVHLLTFYQDCKKQGSLIEENVNIIRKKFQHSRIIHKIISTEKLVRWISYDRYGHYFLKHKLLVLSTCGFTTLSWHVRAIIYCMENQIDVVADGLTKELMHFPGHMDSVIEVFRELYKHFHIEYINPVRDWPTPADQQFIDRLVVDQHGYFFPSESRQEVLQRTTGRYLYDLGIMPHPNVKGSPRDEKMQYDCYPFVLYNMMVFWIYLAFSPYELLCEKMKLLFTEKSADMSRLLDEYKIKKTTSRLANYIES